MPNKPISLFDVQLFLRDAPGDVRTKVMETLGGLEGGTFLVPATTEEESVLDHFVKHFSSITLKDLEGITK